MTQSLAVDLPILLVDDESTWLMTLDRKSTRLNSSHLGTSYAAFCLKKKKKKKGCPLLLYKARLLPSWWMHSTAGISID